jgi:hypothetical protein
MLYSKREMGPERLVHYEERGGSPMELYLFLYHHTFQMSLVVALCNVSLFSLQYFMMYALILELSLSPLLVTL